MNFQAIKDNPVRLFAIASAALALIVFYVPGLPVALILGLVGAILGIGESVRANVTPTAHVHVDDRELEPIKWDYLDGFEG